MDEQVKKPIGYLVVQVTTANSAIPLSGASVTVTADSPDSADAIYELTSGAGGRTARVPLETVSRAESESPGTDHPYTTYNVEVAAPGYERAIYQGIAIFEGITAFQQANLTPIPENGYPDSYTMNGPQIFQNTENDL